MREIRYTKQFKRDYKREKTGRHRKILDAALMETVYLLADDMGLPVKNADHPLCGEWADYRDCHIRPDLILIYRKPDEKYLDLVRLGSHAELGF
ncbi:MAG: type II toxin-antitoxin system YafQ family toxin [Syntrophorhabdaceae bacterium]|nr:type II toxin-antitoxin system YafQ family toxin [Syntrophorhabdaceae bacterium]